MSHETGDPSRRYHFFILTLWIQPGALPNAPPVWRYSLEDPRMDQRTGFTSLADLEAYLAAWMEERTSGGW